MKRILLVVLAAVMALSCFACGKKDETVDINAKSEGVMTYAEYEAAPLESKVTIEAYIQAKHSMGTSKILAERVTISANSSGVYNSKRKTTPKRSRSGAES